MSVDIQKLKSLAVGASEGPWYLENGMNQVRSKSDDFVCETYENEPVNSAFIVAANPAAVMELISEIERIAGEEEEASAVVDRLSELLAGVSIAVRGPYLPLQRHSYHDLPERVQALADERDQLKAENEELRKDAARLDWIAENFTGHGGGTEFNLRLHLPCDIDEGGLIHAIDVAMSKEAQS